MKHLKKLLAVVMAASLFSTAAFAAWNLRQKDDGSAVWQYSDNVTEFQVGRLERNVALATIATAVTDFVVSPITGRITSLWVAVDRAVTANTSFWLTAQSRAASSSRTIVSSAFTISAPTTANAVSWAVTKFVPATNFTVARDTVITVSSQGTSAPAGASNARILVQIDPYP